MQVAEVYMQYLELKYKSIKIMYNCIIFVMYMWNVSQMLYIAANWCKYDGLPIASYKQL